MEQSPLEANSYLPCQNVFYGNSSFITLYTKARHWSVSWARCNHSIPSHNISLRSILICSSHLRVCLPSGLFSSGYPNEIFYYFLAPFLITFERILPITRYCVTFRKMLLLQGGVVSPSSNFQVGGPPLIGCQRLLIQYIAPH